MKGSYGKEEIRDIHGNVYRQAHVGEVETVAAPDKRDRDEMMRNQFLEVLPRFLQHQQQHNHLLGPVGRLQEIIRFK